MMLTKEVQNERIKICIEYLRGRDVTSSYWNHFSPYSEEHIDNQGSNLHILRGDTGKNYRFLFGDDNEIMFYQSEKLSSEA